MPAYLGSGFAFIGPALAVILVYGYSVALGAFIATGLAFLLVSGIIRKAGPGWFWVIFQDAVMEWEQLSQSSGYISEG